MEKTNPINNSQTQKFSNFISFLKRNKYYVFAFSLLAILLFIFISLITLASTQEPVEETLIPTPTRVQTRKPKPTVTRVLVIPTQSISSQEKNLLESQTKPQLRNKVAGSFDITTVKPYGEEWAIIEIRGNQTDEGRVVVKKENGVWNVKLGPGTYFEDEQLKAIGAPGNLRVEINSAL